MTVDCCFDLYVLQIFYWYICALAMPQYVYLTIQEVRKHKSCGVLISFVLIFEHCYFVDKCRLSGTISRVSEGWPILSAEIVLNRHKNVDAFFCVQGIFNFL